MHFYSNPSLVNCNYYFTIANLWYLSLSRNEGNFVTKLIRILVTNDTKGTFDLQQFLSSVVKNDKMFPLLPHVVLIQIVKGLHFQRTSGKLELSDLVLAHQNA